MDVRYIVWVDAAGFRDPRTVWCDWSDAAELEPLVCTTVAFVVKETDEIVVIAQSHDEQGEEPRLTQVMAIPRAAIRSMTTLEVPA